jgi:hypothetical protein
MKKLKHFNSAVGQAGQDSFVLNITKEKNQGFYVEIGSALPMTYSNTFLLENIYGWNGVSFELNPAYVKDFNRARSNKCIKVDATKFDYEVFFKDNNFPKQIDYLQIDIDPPHANLEVLKRLPLSNYRFTVITFEHDLYSNPKNAEVKESANQILNNFGYFRFADNVMVKPTRFSQKWEPFEDWYLDASVVTEYNSKTQYKNLPWPKLFRFTIKTKLKFFLRTFRTYRYLRKLFQMSKQLFIKRSIN